MTKCGRYGLDRADFDYSPETIRESVIRSLRRLNTDYLDIVYLHDVEFVASPIYPDDRRGKPLAAVSKSSHLWGLGVDDRGRTRGNGDQIILNALAELFRLKTEGKVKAVGITGTHCLTR
jgi:D-arabinose 1-dehydrogenase